jgi:pSer/pThr/pTyr-binding forkhead associated (FHA) protein
LEVIESSAPLRINLEYEDIPVEEPSECVLKANSPKQPARFHVQISDLFGYEIYLQKKEEAQLTIGCARDNNIVLPHTESRRHLLRLFFAQDQIWVEDCGSTQKALIEGIPLTGTRAMAYGSKLQVGGATIELIKEGDS